MAQSAEYPKYEMVVFSGPVEKREEKRSWHSLGEAAATYDSGVIQVKIGDWVLEEPGGLPRPITDGDRDKIIKAADDYGGDK